MNGRKTMVMWQEVFRNTWKSRNVRLVLAAACLTGTSSVCAQGSVRPSFAVVGSIAGADGGWDYASIDPQSRRLYLARSGVAVFDLTAQRWIETIDKTAIVNGVLPMIGSNTLIFTDRRAGVLVVYDTERGVIRGTVPVGPHADAIAYDPKSSLAAVVSGGEQGRVTLVDLDKPKAVATIRVGGKLEFAVSGGDGTVYVNVESQGQIAVLDLERRRVERRIALTGCESPSGLAFLPKYGLLVAACDKVAQVVRAKDGVILATVATGDGADAVIGDSAHQLAFVPCGESGTLAVIDLSDPERIRVIQTLRTEVGARTGALDPATGKLYLPTAQFGPAVPPSQWPSVLPGTFKLLVVASP
jgi:hypothetical protein